MVMHFKSILYEFNRGRFYVEIWLFSMDRYRKIARAVKLREVSFIREY